MPALADVIRELEGHYDPAWAESWDAVGLVCGDPDAAYAGCCSPSTRSTDVVDEALRAGADLLVTHHPLFLGGTACVAATTAKGRVVHRLISGGCALYVAHTNADIASPGVSDALARARSGSTTLRPLRPQPRRAARQGRGVRPGRRRGRLLDALRDAGAGAIGDYTRCAFRRRRHRHVPAAGRGATRPSARSARSARRRGRGSRWCCPRRRRSAVAARAARGAPLRGAGLRRRGAGCLPGGRGLGRVGELPSAGDSGGVRPPTSPRALPATAWGVRAAGDPRTRRARSRSAAAPATTWPRAAAGPAPTSSSPPTSSTTRRPRASPTGARAGRRGALGDRVAVAAGAAARHPGGLRWRRGVARPSPILGPCTLHPPQGAPVKAAPDRPAAACSTCRRSTPRWTGSRTGGARCPSSPRSSELDTQARRSCATTIVRRRDRGSATSAASRRKAEADVEQVRTARRARPAAARLRAGHLAKELESLQHEIESLARRQSELEDVELEVMERLEDVAGRARRSCAPSASRRPRRRSEAGAAPGRGVRRDRRRPRAAPAPRASRARDAARRPAGALREDPRGQRRRRRRAMLRGRVRGLPAASSTRPSCRRSARRRADEVLRCEECRRILVRTAESGL